METRALPNPNPYRTRTPTEPEPLPNPNPGPSTYLSSRTRSYPEPTSRHGPDLARYTKEIYQVQEVVGSSWDKRKKKVLYFVIWEGYPDREDWTEEPYEHFVAESEREALGEFHRANPTPGRDPMWTTQGLYQPGQAEEREGENESCAYTFFLGSQKYSGF